MAVQLDLWQPVERGDDVHRPSFVGVGFGQP
jgi:hypothetical protein